MDVALKYETGRKVWKYILAPRSWFLTEYSGGVCRQGFKWEIGVNHCGLFVEGRNFHSIVVGDMNENPYEDGCLDTVNLHGIPSGKDTLRETRKIEGKEFKMFYNPMWNLFGDFNEPSGTYFYSGNKTSNPFWHILDQVMVRPSLYNKFVNESLKILYKTENSTLLDDKMHPNKNISDHLPIMFEIKE